MGPVPVVQQPEPWNARVPGTFAAFGMCGRHNVPESTLRFHQSRLIYLPLIRKSRMSGAPCGVGCLVPSLKGLPSFSHLTQDLRPGLFLFRPAGWMGGCAVREGAP